MFMVKYEDCRHISYYVMLCNCLHESLIAAVMDLRFGIAVHLIMLA